MSSNGMITKIWGPSLWISLHTITFGYPINPTLQQKRMYKNFFISLGDILPCKYCRESYKQFIITGYTTLSDEIFDNRTNLTKWLFYLHNKVNNKLSVNYFTTYDEIVSRYESCRAKCTPKSNGCVIPIDNNLYKNIFYKDCPVISPKVANYFVKYAEYRKIEDKYIKFYQKINKKMPYYLANKKNKLWIVRNKICTSIISYMRLHDTPSIELNGRWKGLPSVHELKLILLCSSLKSNHTLIRIIKDHREILNVKCNKIYFLQK